jgi:hypothetical protein
MTAALKESSRETVRASVLNRLRGDRNSYLSMSKHFAHHLFRDEATELANLATRLNILIQQMDKRT